MPDGYIRGLEGRLSTHNGEAEGSRGKAPRCSINATRPCELLDVRPPPELIPPLNFVERTLLIQAAMIAAALTVSSPTGGSDLVSSLADCRRISDAAKRLNCFDRAVGTLVEAAAREDVILVDREEVRRTRKSLFGFSLPKLPLFNARAGAQGTDEVRELETTIQSSQPAGYGLWSMTLAEGGTWQTTEASRRLDLRAGQSVHLERGPVGGYMANIGGARAVRVRRVN